MKKAPKMTVKMADDKTIRDSFDYLKANEDRLNDSQIKLVKSLKSCNHRYGLSSKQQNILSEVVKSIKSDNEILIIKQNY